MLAFDYPTILSNFSSYLDPKRSESASFLIWYLEHYYRLDSSDAVDAVCDQRGDKGVDGIFVNDSDQTITIFQSKINQSENTTIGDASLREFAGTLTQFATPESVSELVSSAGTARVGNLARTLDLTNKVKTYEVKGEFLSNVELDANGSGFLAGNQQIHFVGRKKLKETYISDARDLPEHPLVSFDVVGFPVAEYVVDAQTRAIIAPVKATELVRMEGIADQSLYAYNVRGPLGRTGVNKDIVKSLENTQLHKLFPLFHNGITVVTRSLESQEGRVQIAGCYVVNGCQSLTSLFTNRQRLTDDLRVLTKFVQTDPESTVAEMVTHFSNNQNGVKPRDFKSNNSIQIRLQNEFRRDYPNRFTFEIKQGELLPPGEPISNEEAGLLLMAFDLKEPWATHRKYQVFDDKHAELFARPEVTADRIVLCHTVMEAVLDGSSSITNRLFGKYRLTRYLLMYIIRMLLDSDEQSCTLLQSPEELVRDETIRERFATAIKRIVDDIIIDLNHEVATYGDDFDYRDKLRDQEWVKGISRRVVADHLKLISRGRIKSFAEEWRDAVNSLQPSSN